MPRLYTSLMSLIGPLLILVILQYLNSKIVLFELKDTFRITFLPFISNYADGKESKINSAEATVS